MEKAKSSGFVRGVFSGDCVELGPSLAPSLAARQRFYLAYLQAPHMGSNQREEEPFAFEAREFLRKRLITQKVSYKFEYEHNNRPFVTLYHNAENINQLLLAQGLARLMSKRKEFAASAYNDPYTLAAADAENKGLGVYASGEARLAGQRKVTYSLDESFDAAGFVKAAIKAGKPAGAIIEHVFPNGSAYQLYVPFFKVQVKVNLAYIFPPLAKKNEEAIALKACAFSYARLLHRTVGLKVEGLDRNGSVVGRLLHPAGDIAEELLKQGFAKVVAPQKSEDKEDLTPKFDQDYFAKLKQVEVIAKSKKLGLWAKKAEDAAAPSGQYDSDEEEEKLYLAAQEDKSKGPPPVNKVASKRGACFQAQVVEVASGDLIGLATNDDEYLHAWRVNLAGVKAPSQSRRDGETGAMTEDQPWAWEAREYLRDALVGKRVTVLVEKTRKTKANALMVLVSMWVHQKTAGSFKNVAVMLLERGFAAIQFPRMDEDAVRNFEDLSAASDSGKAKKAGMHSGKNPGPPKFNELYGRDNKQRAKDYERYVVGKKRVEGVIDNVMGLNRYKLRLTSNNARISFACQGVRGVMSKDEQGEAIDRKGFLFNRKHLLQRTVLVDIDQIDNHGNYFGNMTLPKGEDYAELLLREGLVYVNESQKGSFDVSRLRKAEAVAREAGRGIWAPEMKLLVEGALGSTAPVAYNLEAEVRMAEVCDMYDARAFHVRFLETIAELEEVEAIMKNEDWEAAKRLDATTRGTKCAAQFSVDNLWYRAEVLGSAKEKGKVEVVFIDYGNKEVVTAAALRKLPAAAFKFRPQAARAELAGIKAKGLSAGELGVQCGKEFKAAVWERKLRVQEVGRAGGGLLQVVIWSKPEDAHKYQASVNARLLKKGLARSEAGLPLAMQKAFDGAQTEAKVEQLGLWEEDEEDEDEGF